MGFDGAAISHLAVEIIIITRGRSFSSSSSSATDVYAIAYFIMLNIVILSGLVYYHHSSERTQFLLFLDGLKRSISMTSVNPSLLSSPLVMISLILLSSLSSGIGH